MQACALTLASTHKCKRCSACVVRSKCNNDNEVCCCIITSRYKAIVQVWANDKTPSWQDVSRASVKVDDTCRPKSASVAQMRSDVDLRMCSRLILVVMHVNTNATVAPCLATFLDCQIRHHVIIT